MAQQHSVGYTIIFAGIVCAFFGAVVSVASVSLKGRVKQNKLIYRQKQVLSVAGLLDTKESPSDAQVEELFEKNIRAVAINLKTGEENPNIDNPIAIDACKITSDPQLSVAAPENPAKVDRLLVNTPVFYKMQDNRVAAIILPVKGYGLWSTLCGYLALAPDTTTVQGITFYEHGETPGLGGEVDNPLWKKQWSGRKAFNENWQPTLSVIKGKAGPPKKDPYHVDGLSGATLTSNGVSNLLDFWLGDHGFGSYLQNMRKKPSSQGGKG